MAGTSRREHLDENVYRKVMSIVSVTGYVYIYVLRVAHECVAGRYALFFLVQAYGFITNKLRGRSANATYYVCAINL